jgi:glucose 1-dehydrogenase
MGHTIAAELISHHINVNSIEPGWIDTPGERQYATEDELREEGKKLPWGRMGTIEDIGQAAAFLCSPAADYITGAVLRVDGGFWLPVRG